jgi:hypothetical protein
MMQERERAHPRMVFVCKSLGKIHPFDSVECGWTGVVEGPGLDLGLPLLRSRFAFFFLPLTFSSSQKTLKLEIELESASHEPSLLPSPPFGPPWSNESNQSQTCSIQHTNINT